MILELDKLYEDRNGKQWRVTSLRNGQREDIGPISASRWEGNNYQNRIFKRDGTYSVPDTEQWHLIKKVLPTKEKQ